MNQTTPVLKGLRRELTRELFEELGSLQCGLEEILGYIGTNREALEKWCRRVYGRPDPGGDAAHDPPGRPDRHSTGVL